MKNTLIATLLLLPLALGGCKKKIDPQVAEQPLIGVQINNALYRGGAAHGDIVFKVHVTNNSPEAITVKSVGSRIDYPGAETCKERHPVGKRLAAGETLAVPMHISCGWKKTGGVEGMQLVGAVHWLPPVGEVQHRPYRQIVNLSR